MNRLKEKKNPEQEIVPSLIIEKAVDKTGHQFTIKTYSNLGREDKFNWINTCPKPTANITLIE